MRNQMTNYELRFTIVLFFLVGCALCFPPGCTRSPQPRVDGCGWMVVQGSSAGVVVWKGKVRLIVWCDAEGNGDFQGSTSANRDDCRASLQLADGRIVRWSSHITEGKPGEVIINGQRFDLGQGALLLVSSREGDFRITQLQRDLSTIKAHEEDLIRFAASDADLKQFLAKRAPPQ
jgi:hypothetical protein